jgi:hypothetical protein
MRLVAGAIAARWIARLTLSLRLSLTALESPTCGAAPAALRTIGSFSFFPLLGLRFNPSGLFR